MIRKGVSPARLTARCLLGVEYDEHPVEEPDTGQGRYLECQRCSARMRTARNLWLSSYTTRIMLRAVAEILTSFRHNGESILMQLVEALSNHPAIKRRLFNEYQVMLIESMLMECLEDPRPLLTSTLGRNHPLIVAARQRPPPSDEEAAHGV